MKRILLIILASVAMIGSLLYINRLTQQLAEEEQQKVEIWAEATRQFILAGPNDNIDFVSSIIEGNTTIPVFMTSKDGEYLYSRNVELPKRLQREGREAEAQEWMQHRVDELKGKCEPIEVRLSRTQIQYIYYDESSPLRQLHYLPYIQMLIVLAFALILIVSLSISYKAEENRVWVGLCKETAHQLGTPISSLNGWNEVLKAQYPDDPSFQEIDNDIRRLSVVTERFSKIGSRPKLQAAAVAPIVEQTVDYMKRRTSQRISYSVEIEEGAENAQAMLAEPLFAWVIENLIRNSVDAMEGEGKIGLRLREKDNDLILDVTDTGKGIERRRFRRVFHPGYTTKTRGWGLGLSLSKRIIKEYHHGKIFVAESTVASPLSPEQQHGTTFRIILQKTEG